jgi:structural maintenance of chromosomes protein 5
VKDQKKEGFIELELKGKVGTRNIVIRRNLFSDKKSSTFTLNGKSATGKEVNEKIAQLNIQVGNLW